MNTLRLFDRQAMIIVSAIILLLATAIPAIVSAAQVTERSIALSSSSAGATGVTYTTNFTAVGAAGAFVIDFCGNSPVVGISCTAPVGFDASAVASATSGFTDVAALSNNTVRVTGTINADDQVSVALSGITNPDNVGVIYARVITYDTAAHANAYDDTNLGTGNVDDGSMAISITPTIGVSGAVLESMTFCVSGETIAANCIGGGAAAPALTAPTLKLGQNTGGTIALNSANVYTGTIYTQLSTNAVSGAIVSLKSDATGCGGLVRQDASTNAEGCGIAPALNTDITAGQAKFGVKTATAVGVSGGSGVLQPIAYYNNSTFALRYVSGDGTGVTSTYGDPFLDTDSAPLNNMGMAITFGASAANNTPAGLYSADLSMIATGKF